MIQELLGGSSGFISTGERKISINAAGVLAPHIPSPPLPSSTTTATTSAAAAATPAAAPAAASSNSENQNLRCPRCDSSNTKFCYYNNYNLTQPRHFCKTCRRYWTKGGSLRNVPIGGGCRKNKSVSASTNSVAKTSGAVGKVKTAASELGSRSSGLGGGGVFDHPDLPASPILWGSPQNSHLLALLRASQNPNPSPCPNNLMPNNAVNPKEEGNLMRSHMVTEPMGSNGLLNVPATSGFDPSLGLTSSFWRNNNLDQPQNGGFVFGEHQHQNSGIQELYQRLRSSSSANYCSDDSSSLFLSNMASSSLSSSSSVAILESSSTPANGSGIGLGYWNQPLFWSDLPTTNGAHP